MSPKRIGNLIASIACFVVVAVWPLRTLLATTGGASEREQGARYAAIVIALVVGGIGVVLLTRAIRGDAKAARQE